MADTTCAVEICDREVLARGWCSGHYERWRSTGDPGSSALRARLPKICIADGCEQPPHARGFCSTHDRRIKVHGDHTVRVVLAGPDHYKWSAGDASYAAVHFRLKKARGSARNYLCAHCGARGFQWAYDNNDPDERTGLDHGYELRYSVDPAHYMSLCASCHKRYDLRHGKQEACNG